MKFDQRDWILSGMLGTMDRTDNTPMWLVGSIVAGGLALSMSGLWFIGIAVSALGIIWVEKRHNTMLDTVDYSVKYGVAPITIRTKKGLREYLDQMGRDQTARQILQVAKAHPNYLAPIHWKLLQEVYGNDLVDLLNRPITDEDVDFYHDIKPYRQATQQATVLQLPSDTTLQSDSDTVLQLPSDTALQSDSDTVLQDNLPFTPEIMNPVDVLGDRLRSLLIIAPTGAGKGILISNLIRHFKAKYPNLKVFAFDGKNQESETGYWLEGFNEVVRVNLDQDEPSYVAEWILKLISRASTAPFDSIVMIDELNSLIKVLGNGQKHSPSKEKKQICGKALGTILRKLSTAASLGDGRNHHVWGIGQVPNLSALGLNGGEANQLRKVAIAVKTNPTHTDQLVLETGFTGIRRDAEYRSLIDRCIELSPIKRAWYDSGTAKWYAMPVLPNYSGYDRDSRQVVAIPKSKGLQKSKILVGYGSNSSDPLESSDISWELERTRRSLLLSKEDAEKIHQHLKAQGLWYDPSSSQLDNFKSAETVNPKNKEFASAVNAKEDDSLSDAVNELAEMVSVLPEQKQRQVETLIPKIHDLQKEKRSDLLWICVLSAEKGLIKAADVCRLYKYKPWFKRLASETGSNISDAIRNLFLELQSLGIGQCSDAGDRLGFNLLPDLMPDSQHPTNQS